MVSFKSGFPLMKILSASTSREIPAVGSFNRDQLREAYKVSNTALAEFAPQVQWERSYVAGDKTLRIYLAEDEAAIYEYAKISSIPASRITRVLSIIDPKTAN
jgi:hypothetical protein